jgi:hypothetical protein
MAACLSCYTACGVGLDAPHTAVCSVGTESSAVLFCLLWLVLQALLHMCAEARAGAGRAGEDHRVNQQGGLRGDAGAGACEARG